MRKFIAGLAAALVLTAAAAPTAYADEWKETKSGYVYRYSDGTEAPKGWLKLDGKTYYIKKDGTRQTGWLKTSSAKYYFGSDGVMYKDRWLTLKSGGKYYLGKDGKAATGVVTIENVEYKFADDGKCLGENLHFVVNTGTGCIHANKKGKCSAAKKIKEANREEIDLGADELADYKGTYWACGVGGCNSKDVKNALPKSKKK